MKSKAIIILLAIVLALSVAGNVFQYSANHRLAEEAAILQANIASQDTNILQLTEQVSELQLIVDNYANQKETYWSLAVDDYKIFLQDGSTADTLDLICYQNDEEKLLLTFEKEYDYQIPEDISAEAFENCLGHQGFRLYTRRSLGTSSHYYEVDYYAMEEELKLLAYRWGSKDDNFYEVDLDDDGTRELICNVTWMADGAQDVFIYHFDGEKVLKGCGSDLLDEPTDIHGVGAIAARYLPEENKVHIDYWQDSIQDFQEKDYVIDLDKLNLSDFIR